MSTTDEEPTLEPSSSVSFEAGERQHRLGKLDALRARGVEPYPVRFDRDTTAAALHATHAALAPDSRTGVTVSVAGRLTGLRRHGGLDFGDLRDETGTIQLLADRAHLGDDALEDFAALDLGDWVGATGEVLTTKTGELSIELRSFALLSKALRPLPDLRHGLTDPDTRQRQRYLDLIANEHSRRVFAIRSAAIDAIRQTFRERGFTEVETPVLLSQAGGASATPFLTHHNALNLDMTMRIALELPLKRLLVGGMNRVFEIGRVFRNEGIDTRHNPEFTELEAYQAFADYHDMMDLTEALIRNAAQAALGTTVVRIAGQEVDLAKPFRRATMIELIRENAGVEMHPSMPIEEARAIADKFGIAWLPVWGAGAIMNEVYDESSEHLLLEPTFVMDHPKEISPLARTHRDDPWLVERFELVVAGRELANAYSELNDPVDQAARFRDQARMQAGGEEEAEPADDDYVLALEYGLPPTGGVGVGIDRLIMLLAEAEAIRDVLLFPTLRPAEGTAVPAQVEQAKEAEAVREAAELLPPPPATPRPVTRRPASLFWIAWATVGVAILAMLPSVPFVEWSFGIGNILERSSRGVTFVLSAAAGVVLLFLARQLYLGKRRAWVVTVVLVAAATVIHLLKGPDPIPVIANLAVLVALLWFRDDFKARTNPRSLIEAVAFVPLYLIVVGIFGFLSLWTQANHVNPRVTFVGGLETIYGGLIGIGDKYTYTRASFEEFFEDALLALGILGVVILLYLLLRTFVQREPHGEEDRARARAIVERWGGDTLAYFALRKDKSYFFSSDGQSLVAYAYVRGFAMVAADPIGPPQDTGRTLDEFLMYCRDRGWSVAFLAVREADSRLYRDRGMHVLYLGDEAVLHCDTFSLQGREMKAVREAVNRVGRDHSFELMREDTLSPEIVAELNEISDEWREGAAERGFTMELGEDVEGTRADFVIALARDKAGAPAGFLRFVPAYDAESPGYSLDLMRRKPGSTNGLTEFLIANAATALGQEGVKRLSLNFAAWGRLLDTAENAGFWGRAEGWVARKLNPYFQIQSLRDFNAKFDPEWYPRSMVVDDVADLPKVALLYASVEGFLEIPLLGRLLVPPVRQAAVTGAAPVAPAEPAPA